MTLINLFDQKFAPPPSGANIIEVAEGTAFKIYGRNQPPGLYTWRARLYGDGALAVILDEQTVFSGIPGTYDWAFDFVVATAHRNQRLLLVISVEDGLAPPNTSRGLYSFAVEVRTPGAPAPAPVVA